MPRMEELGLGIEVLPAQGEGEGRQRTSLNPLVVYEGLLFSKMRERVLNTSSSFSCASGHEEGSALLPSPQYP